MTQVRILAGQHQHRKKPSFMEQNVSDIYSKFKSVVEKGKYEAPLQTFLEEHSEILELTFNQGAHLPTVFPKFHLADEFVPDFVMIGHRSIWSWDVDLIEIEPSAEVRPLFNKKRQPAGRLRDAEAQINDWRAWMRKYENAVFVPRVLEKLKEKNAWNSRPEFYNLSDGTRQSMTVWHRIIIGRREDFKAWGTTYQDLKWEQSGHRDEIVPWDRLLEKSKLIAQRV